MSWIHEMFDVPEDKIEQFEAYCEFEEAMERGNQEEPKESSLSYQEGKGKEKIMDNPFLEANINLNKKIDELEKRIRELSWFESNYPHLDNCCRDLEKQLAIKRSVVSVKGIYPSDRTIAYALPVTVAEDTPEGMYIVVELPAKFLKGK